MEYRRIRMIYIWLILLIAVLSYREVLHLIQRGSWNDWDYWNVFWYTEHNSMWKDWDSFHFANGLATLIIIEVVIGYLPCIRFFAQYVGEFVQVQLNVVLYWLLWMHVRNIFLHIILKREPKWKYLLPQIIYNLFRK